MDFYLIIFVAVTLAVITILYKTKPYKSLAEKIYTIFSN